MGIKFLCPNGHKLHVKAFLSGKRAICPKCGARVVVPAEDSAMADGGLSAAAREGVATESIEIPLVESPSGEMTPAVNVAQGASGAAAEATPPSPPPRPPVHPLDEVPGAVWYVRPASGGQYGPASGEIMRDWLAEGRVGANSLVWRAGWSDWRNAAAVFPQLGQPAPTPAPQQASAAGSTGNGMPPLPQGHAVQHLAPSPQATSHADDSLPGMPPLAQQARKRRRKKDVRLIASAILAVVSLILVIVLVLVSRGQSGPSDPKTEEPPAGGEETLI